MTTFKVGELVKIVGCDHGQPKDMLGKTMTIDSINNDIAYIKSQGENFYWALFFFSELEHLGANIYKEHRFLQGKFTVLDGTPGVVDVHIRGNTTQVTIIVGPQEEYHACNKNKQFFSGIAFCSPCDKFDINIGIKEACKKIFGIDRDGWYYETDDEHAYQRSIYSSIRSAMRGTK